MFLRPLMRSLLVLVSVAISTQANAGPIYFGYFGSGHIGGPNPDCSVTAFQAHTNI